MQPGCLGQSQMFRVGFQ